MITEAQALDALRLDVDPTTTGLVRRYLSALPAAIEAATGVPAEVVAGNSDLPLLEVLELYLVQLWYCPDGTDSDRLRIVIDSLIGTIKAQRVAWEMTE